MNALRYAQGAASDTPHLEKLHLVKSMVVNRQHAALKANDELTREMEAQRVFAGWTDALDFSEVRNTHKRAPN